MNDATATPAARPPDSVGVVLPNDNRKVVPDSTIAPFCWIGQVRTTWSNGDATVGTGVLYGEMHVLTCAHNFIYRGGPTAVRSSFTMGLNRGARSGPAPGVPVALAAFDAPKAYRTAGPPPPPPDGVPEGEATKYLHDIAVARLNTSVPEPPGESHFVLGPIPPNPIASRLIGYSGDRDPQAATQYDRAGPSNLDPNGDILTYKMSTFGGDSGAPVFYPIPDPRNLFAVIGVHVSGVKDIENFAVPLTADNIDLVGNLINRIDQGHGTSLRT